jgi:hypothetical protein
LDVHVFTLIEIAVHVFTHKPIQRCGVDEHALMCIYTYTTVLSYRRALETRSTLDVMTSGKKDATGDTGK